MTSVPGTNSWVIPVKAWVRITESMTLRSTVSGTYIVGALDHGRPVLVADGVTEFDGGADQHLGGLAGAARRAGPPSPRQLDPGDHRVRRRSSQARTSPSRSRVPRRSATASSRPALVCLRSRFFCASHWSSTRWSTVASFSRTSQPARRRCRAPNRRAWFSPALRIAGVRRSAEEVAAGSAGASRPAARWRGRRPPSPRRSPDRPSSSGVLSLRTMSRLVRVRVL